MAQLSTKTAQFDLLTAHRTPAFRSPRLNALYRYWQSRRDGALPQRADIEPADIKPLLPYVLIVDIHRDPFRVFYRLVGTAVAHFSGMDFTGTFLDDLAFDICAAEDLSRAYQAVCTARQPGTGIAFSQATNQSALDVEYLICPLADETGAILQCLVIEDYVTAIGLMEAQDSGNLRGKTFQTG